MSAPTSYLADPKQAAIDQWTADPCGPAVAGRPGSRTYFEALLDGRARYAPWMEEVLDYAGTRGLDVLDVGCGQGMDLARYGAAGARVTGIDLTPRHVELARDHLAAVELPATVIIGDAEHMPFEAESFDRVSSNGVLHHTPDMAAALREIRRVLRPAGEVRLILYNRWSIQFWVNLLFRVGVLHGRLLRERSIQALLASSVEVTSIGARPLVRVYSRRELRRLLRSAGFTDLRFTVRHFTSPFASRPRLEHVIRRYVGGVVDEHVLDWVGRVAGWYIVARAVR